MANGRAPGPFSGRQYPIAAGAFAATITEVGAGLRSYTVDGVDVTCTYGEDELPPKCCGITLVPWPNRIRDGRYDFDGVTQQLALTEPDKHNAIHGLGRWARWDLLEQADDSVRLGLDVVPQKGYPFQIRAEVRYSLDERGLRVELSARNDGTQRAPFGMGSHPYLSTRTTPLAETTVQIPANQVLEVDDAQIPGGTRPVAESDHDLRRGRRLRELRFDTGFADLTVVDGRGHAEVRTAAGGAHLWFDETFRYLQVFTREDLTPGQHGVAIEPMTCAPDAFNSGAGLIVLEPGEAWSGSWGISPLA